MKGDIRLVPPRVGVGLGRSQPCCRRSFSQKQMVSSAGLMSKSLSDLRAVSPCLRRTVEKVYPSTGTTLPAVPKDRPLTLSIHLARSFCLLTPPLSLFASSTEIVAHYGIAI